MDQFKRIRRTLNEAVEDLVLGYQIAPGPERATVAALLSFGGVALGTRAAGSSPASPQVRRGAAGILMLAGGLAAVLNRDDGRELRYAAPLGIGAAFAMDDAPPLMGLAGIAATLLGLAGAATDLRRRGAVHRAIRQLAAGP